MPDVKVVRLPVSGAIKSEFGILNHDRAAGDIALQNSVLVVVEFAIQHGKVRAVLANAGAVVSFIFWN